MDLKYFLKGNLAKRGNEKVRVSERFKDDKGNIIEFEIKPITNQRDTDLRNAFTSQVKVKKGIYQPSLDTPGYMKALVSECLVYPNLNDKTLQDSYGVFTASDLLNELFLPGEYNELLVQVQAVNGWDISIEEKKDEVKN